MIRKGDRVRVLGAVGDGIAMVEKVSRKWGVCFLDRRMTIRYPGYAASTDLFVSYWTFSLGRLEKVEVIDA